jgi:hypothetical protein
LVFKKSTAVHLFFYLAGFFLFGVGEIYNTLTLLAIVTNLSFQFLYGLVAARSVHVATEQLLILKSCNYRVTLNAGFIHALIESRRSIYLVETRCIPSSPGLSLDTLVFKLVCDKATTVHKISTNMKKMS